MEIGLNKLSMPVAWCEVCDVEIVDASKAAVYWRSGDERTPITAHESCMPERQLAKYDRAMSLASFMVVLCSHAGLGGEKLKAAFRDAHLTPP